MENSVYNHLSIWLNLSNNKMKILKKNNSIEFDFLPGKIFHGVQILNIEDDSNSHEINFKVIYDYWENKLD